MASRLTLKASAPPSPVTVPLLLRKSSPRFTAVVRGSSAMKKEISFDSTGAVKVAVSASTRKLAKVPVWVETGASISTLVACSDTVCPPTIGLPIEITASGPVGFA